MKINTGQFQKSAKDLTGQKFTRLTVVSYSHAAVKNHYWNCVCECGKERIARADHLKKGGVKSCGCLLKENNKGLKHGLCHTPLYSIWIHIRQRCNDPSTTGYKNYGGNGVRVCKEWDDFVPFFLWAIENKWEKGMHVCRKGDVGDYSPDNCYIATHLQNNRDRKNNKLNMLRARIMRRLRLKTKLSHRRIGAFYGVSTKTAENTIKGRLWATN